MIAFVIFITLLQVFDGWTTYQILKRPFGREKNKLIREFIEMLSTRLPLRKAQYLALLIFKAGAALLVWILYLLPTVDVLTEMLQSLGIVSLAAWYVVVAKNNWNVYRGA